MNNEKLFESIKNNHTFLCKTSYTNKTWTIFLKYYLKIEMFYKLIVGI